MAPTPRIQGIAQALALGITHTIKLGGVAVTVNEILIRGQARPIVIAISAFMMAGAQVSETAALAFIDRLMGRPPEATPSLPPAPPAQVVPSSTLPPPSPPSNPG